MSIRRGGGGGTTQADFQTFDIIAILHKNRTASSTVDSWSGLPGGTDRKGV